MAKEKVLIVDDEVDVLDLCKRILTVQGYQVESAHNGYEALEIAQQKPLDLLLTDIKMPGMSGLEIAQHLKELDPSIICVTMTGFSTMDMAINALKLGIDEFILKPFTPKELGAAISKALEKERLRKENFRLRSLIPLFELNKTLMSTVDEEDVLNRLLEIAQQETKATFAGIYLITDNQITTTMSLNQGHSAEAYQPAGGQLALAMIDRDEPTMLTLATDDDQANLLATLEADSALVIPLKSQNARLGALILTRTEGYFAPGDTEFLSVLCGQASVALENARLFSEIQEAYEQLQILDHMKSEFINIAAHELRTPLAILMGYAAVLEEEVSSAQQSYISNISRNAVRLRSLIDDMLNLQYLESGIPELSQEEINLQEFTEEVMQDMMLLTEEKQLNVQINVDEDVPILVIDQQKLDLILVNLLDNAIKFTPPGGMVTFKAGLVSPEKIEVFVHNTGSLIPKEKLNQIFDRFYQVEQSLTREHGGAGLGLAIVRGMIDVCGGSITVESSPDSGTTFRFMLPVNNSHVEPRRLKL